MYLIIIRFACLVIIGYLLGNFSFARMITIFKERRQKKEENSDVDITKTGSGNPGSMNMLRTQGAIMGFTTLCMDALKAIIPALLGYLFFKDDGEIFIKIAIYVGGFSAVLGHIYPVFYKFKGGKGIACTVGTFFVADPIVALIAFGIAFVFFLFVKIGSLTSFVYILTFAIWQTCLPSVNQYPILLILIWTIIALDLFAHRSNIVRLLTNKERITSFQDGVKKDIERIKAKKEIKLQKIDIKADKVDDKISKKLESKKERKIRKYENKGAKVERKYDKKINKISNREEKITKVWTTVANKYEEKEQKKGLKKKDKESVNSISDNLDGKES